MRRRCAGVKSAKHSVSRQRSVHTAQYKCYQYTIFFDKSKKTAGNF